MNPWPEWPDPSEIGSHSENNRYVFVVKKDSQLKMNKGRPNDIITEHNIQTYVTEYQIQAHFLLNLNESGECVFVSEIVFIFVCPFSNKMKMHYLFMEKTYLNELFDLSFFGDPKNVIAFLFPLVKSANKSLSADKMIHRWH